MISYDPQSAVISLHIPKTGGTSVRQLLEAWFPDGRLLPHYYRADTGELPAKHALTGGYCVHGHFNTARGFGVDAYYPDGKQFIAFLREPFDRFLSNWFFMNVRKRNGVRVPFLDGDPDFATFLHDCAEKQAQGKNALSVHWYFPDPHTPELIGDIMDRRFIFLGIMERLQPSIDALAIRLGKQPLQIAHLNATARTEHEFNAWRPFYEKNFGVEFDIYEKALARNAELISECLS